MLKLSGAWLCGLYSVPQGSGLSRLRSSGERTRRQNKHNNQIDPLSPPRIGLHDGAAHGDHGGLDDVVFDDVDINNTDVAGRRRRIRRLELRSSPQ